MPRRTNIALAGLAVAVLLASGGCGEERKGEPEAAAKPAASRGDVYPVASRDVEDMKPVIATVRSKRVVEARVRTPGTVATLKVVEGDYVQPGQILGQVVDPKIALRISASDAQIFGLEAKLANARAEFERASDLAKRGVAPQSRLDQAKSSYDVAINDLSAARSERAVIEKQAEEGAVLAPAHGRVLRVPVTEGSVVLAGESIATIAANDYLLRLEIPERHARFMSKGDTLKVGARGMASQPIGVVEGRIVQIYPEIQGGRVIADAEVRDLGTYFVGERTLAWISAGSRSAIELPKEFVFRRYGLDYVRLAGANGGSSDIVVQLALPVEDGGVSPTVEILAGVKPGDRLVRP